MVLGMGHDGGMEQNQQIVSWGMLFDLVYIVWRKNKMQWRGGVVAKQPDGRLKG